MCAAASKEVRLERTDAENLDFQLLVALLDKDLALRDGDEHAFYAAYNSTSSIRHVVVCYEDEEAVGCGAFKSFDDSTVEIKRMYVTEEKRNRGIAMQVLRVLEQWARELGYKSAVLETGKKQPEAIRLYQKSGYELIENFGQYAGVDNSVCMRKKLDN